MEAKLQQQAPQQNHINKPNLTGIPTQMKLDFEQRSGLSFDDVRVHYNSDKPAQLQALAYTQGTQVYVGPGQERHLPHELGHVVQQKSGIVHPTYYIRGMPINNQPRLEYEADHPTIQCILYPTTNRVIQLCPPGSKEDEEKTDDSKRKRGAHEALGPAHAPEVKKTYQKDTSTTEISMKVEGNTFVPFFDLQYISSHGDSKDSKERGIIGSLYFSVGRIRLTHAHGPEIALFNTSNYARFIVPSTFASTFENEYRKLQETYKDSPDEFIFTKIIEKLESSGQVTNVSSYRKENLNDSLNESNVQLFEIWISKEKRIKTHFSRGGIEAPPKSLDDVLNVQKIYYIVQFAQKAIELICTEAFFTEKTHDLQAAKDALIQTCRIYSQRYNICVHFFRKIETNIGRILNNINIKKKIIDNWIETILSEPKDGDKQDLAKYAFILSQTMLNLPVKSEAANWIAETQGIRAPFEKKIKRIHGFVKNQILWYSGIIKELDLNVDKKDCPEELDI